MASLGSRSRGGARRLIFPGLLVALVCETWFTEAGRAEGEVGELVKVSSSSIGQFHKELHALGHSVPTNNLAAKTELQSLAVQSFDVQTKGMKFLTDSTEQIKKLVDSMDIKQTVDHEKVVRDTAKELASKYQDYAGDLTKVTAGSKSFLTNTYNYHKQAHADIDNALQQNRLENLQRDLNEHHVVKGRESRLNPLGLGDIRGDSSITNKGQVEDDTEQDSGTHSSMPGLESDSRTEGDSGTHSSTVRESDSSIEGDSITD